MWDSMLEILEEKAAQGVEVKMLYDDIGCMVTLPGDYTVHLRSKGINAHKFNKVIPRMTVAYNNRDHRKILVIDGQISYTGGINLADEYINHIERFGHWKDSGIPDRWSGDSSLYQTISHELVHQPWGNQ